MAKHYWFDKYLKWANYALLLLIILINGYVIMTPFLPQVTYKVAQVFTEPQKVETPEQRTQISRDSDHVVIPRIGLDQKIWIGDNEKLVNKGVWQVFGTSSPDKGSNTVLVGHRFSYKDPAVFYHLDKMQIDDPVVVAWGGKLYTYKVNEKKVVNPTDVYVEESTDDSRLTLYTCEPLWSTKKRLVIVARLEAVE